MTDKQHNESILGIEQSKGFEISEESSDTSVDDADRRRGSPDDSQSTSVVHSSRVTCTPLPLLALRWVRKIMDRDGNAQRRLQGVLRYTEVCRDFLRSVQVYRGRSGSVEVYTEVGQGVLGYTEMGRGLLRYRSVEVYRGV